MIPTDDQGRIQYFAARRVWKVKDQLTPEGGITWAKWFKKRFGRSLEQAIAEYRKGEDNGMVGGKAGRAEGSASQEVEAG